MWEEGEIPAGDLEGRTKDLGTHKLSHDDMVTKVSYRGGEFKVEERCVCMYKQNNNLILVVAAVVMARSAEFSVPWYRT